MRVSMRFLAAALVLLVGTAFADPIIDGKFDPGEGYSTMLNLNYTVDGDPTVYTDGILWLHTNGAGDVFAALIQSTSLVDNSYGTNSIGWGALAPSGKSHSFSDLLNSDEAEITLRDSMGIVVGTFALDYLDENSKGSGGPYFASVESASGGISIVAGDVMFASSLDYNLNTAVLGSPADPNYLVNSPSTAGLPNNYTDPSEADWIYDNIYEFKIDGSVFASSSNTSAALSKRTSSDSRPPSVPKSKPSESRDSHARPTYRV